MPVCFISQATFTSSTKELTSVLKHQGIVEAWRAGFLHISDVLSVVELKIFNLRAENPHKDLTGY
jgi:hemoglobin-like flavoprotein